MYTISRNFKNFTSDNSITEIVGGNTCCTGILISNDGYTMIGANYVESNEIRNMDYKKCYVVYSGGRCGAYPSGKVSKCEFLTDTNGFTYQMSSGSGYGLEFPIEVDSGKSYEFKYTPETGYLYSLMLWRNITEVIALNNISLLKV